MYCRFTLSPNAVLVQMQSAWNKYKTFVAPWEFSTLSDDRNYIKNDIWMNMQNDKWNHIVTPCYHLLVPLSIEAVQGLAQSLHKHEVMCVNTAVGTFPLFSTSSFSFLFSFSYLCPCPWEAHMHACMHTPTQTPLPPHTQCAVKMWLQVMSVHISKCTNGCKKNTTSASCRWCPLQVQVRSLH